LTGQNKIKLTVDAKFKKATTLQKVLIIIGCLCFITAGVFVITHLGFVPSTHHSKTANPFLTTEELWLINAGLGLFGGVLLNFKQPIISALSGLLAGLGITGFGIVYVSWRDSLVNVEMLLVLGIGVLPGVFVYSFLLRKYKARKAG
jgi:hypothetical protein